MKNKILLVLVALVAIPLLASAQEKEKKDVFHKNKSINFYSHQISVGYGFGSAAQWIANFDGKLDPAHNYDGKRYWGDINVKYLYRYSDIITFGLSYTYTGLRKDIYSRGSLMGRSDVNINIIMPEFKSDWYKTDIITLYSRASAGVAIANIQDEYLDNSKNSSETKVKFAFQASPIGFEIGKQFAFYVEVGFGYQGIIVTGLRYNF